MDEPACVHDDFDAVVTVNRMEDSGAFHADIRITCRDCGVPMQFVGLRVGLAFDQPTTSWDGLELRVPMMPQGQTMPTGLPGFRLRQ